jgi:multidrug efflux pump subunit AcrA (membrane-fusion protein)
MVRAGLRARLDEPEDPLDDASDALQRAQAQLQFRYGAETEAISYELAQASANLARARLLANKGSATR